MLKVITDYTYALDVLDKYDHRALTIEATHKKESFVATYEEVMKAIKGLKEKFGGSSLFGNEKDESFKSSIAAIYQSFGSTDFYPSIEEKAAHLLYFVVKIIPSATETSASQHFCLCGFFRRTGFCTALMAPSGSLTMLLLR